MRAKILRLRRLFGRGRDQVRVKNTTTRATTTTTKQPPAPATIAHLREEDCLRVTGTSAALAMSNFRLDLRRRTGLIAENSAHSARGRKTFSPGRHNCT